MTEPREAETQAATEDGFQLSQQDLDAIGKAIDADDGPALERALSRLIAAEPESPARN